MTKRNEINGGGAPCEPFSLNTVLCRCRHGVSDWKTDEERKDRKENGKRCNPILTHRSHHCRRHNGDGGCDCGDRPRRVGLTGRNKSRNKMKRNETRRKKKLRLTLRPLPAHHLDAVFCH
jgi:hypothetical protein